MRVAQLTVWLKCLVFALVGLALCAGSASAAESSALGGTGSSPLESPLVVPEALPLLGGEAVSNAEEARRESPEAAVARQVSQTEYEGLSVGEASKLAGEVFPRVVDYPAGGPPQLPEGQHITGFISADAAQVTLPSGEGGHAVLESIEPIATESSPEKWTPINLSLSEVGGVFQVDNPAVDVSIPKRLQDGVSLVDSGVSLTPVDASGAAVRSSDGRVDGAAVFYGGVSAGSDVDELVKPETSGFSEDAILRSAASPEQLFYRVGLPEGASLVQANSGSGAVEVVDEGSVVASVFAPHAQDATGTPVPVAMSVSGDVLKLSVGLHAGNYEYPAYVDPTVTDKELLFKPGNWAFFTDNSAVFGGFNAEPGLEDDDKPGERYYSGQYGFFSYTTQGASRIYAFIGSAIEEESTGNPSVVDQFELRRSNGEIESGNGEGGKAEITEPAKTGRTERTGVTVCAESACGPVGVASSEQNAAYFEQKVVGEETGHFRFTLTSGSVEIQQEKGPTASFDTSDSTLEGQPNALLTGKWYKSKSAVTFGLYADDSGIGVYKQGLSSPSKSGWGFASKHEARNECQGVQCNQCYEPPCAGKASGNGKPLTWALASAEGGELPEGEDTIEGKVEDDVGLKATASGKIKIDNLAPHGITFSGLPSNHEVVDGQHYLLKASATDGVEGTPSSGIASIMLEVDGEAVSGPQGSCTLGPCTGNAEWTLSGENYAAGEHTLTVVATDNAGNVAFEEYHVKIHHPEGVAVGPGSVNPVTGELSVGATDVSLSVPGGQLTVSRGYRSRHVAQGTEGPLGPQWIMSLGAEQSLTRVSGGMVLTGGSGGQVVFEGKGGGEFTSPTGDAGLTLLEKTVEGKAVFTLSENGSVTTFELPAGSSGSVWMPSSTEGPNGTNKALYKFRLSGGVVEPTEELAPIPAGVSCGKEISELKEGCRALKFEYATETKAKGEKASDWGEFIGHLSKVKYVVWNASKTKTEPVVAEYAYDVRGRLRAEWNPEITPSPLKTTYGYDTEGQVTALSTAGHEPTLLEQGTVPGDANPGRLLAVAVPAAATALGSGEAPVNEVVPTLSSSKPAVGTKISVNLTENMPGKWKASPLAFIYQWEDCNSSGKECSPIPGAVNQAYYPVAGDEGHELVAEATALNATGATTVSSEATSTVASGTSNTPLPEPPAVGSNAVTTLEYQVPVSGSGAPYEMGSTEVAKWGQTDVPYEGMAIFPPDKVMGWPAKEYKRETVYYLDGKDRTVNAASSTGGISVAEYNAYNDVVRTLTPDNRLKAVTEGCKAGEECKSATENTYEETGSEPGTQLLSTLGPQHTVKLAVGKEGKVNEEALVREHTLYFYNEGAPSKGGPYHLVTKTIDGAETAGKEEFDKRTTETSYGGQSGLGWELRKPTSVITDPSGLDLVRTTEYNGSTGYVTQTKMPAASGKDAKVPPAYFSEFGTAGSEPGQLKTPRATALAPNGNVYVLDMGNSRIEEFTPSGSYAGTFGAPGKGNGQLSGPFGFAVDSKGNIWVADTGNDRVEEFNSKHEYVLKFGSEGTAGGQFKEPKAIAVTASGTLFVVDAANNRIQKFNEKGEFISTFGSGVSNGEAKLQTCVKASECRAGIAGSGNGQFSEPRGDAVSTTGHVWVADTNNSRIQEFSESGEFLAKAGSYGTGNGQFEEPKGIAIDSAGNTWVTDAKVGRIQKFTSTGAFLSTAGSKGAGAGQFEAAWGLAITSEGEMYIADVNIDRVDHWNPTVTGNEGAHNTKTIYYTTAANSEYKECGEHPGMANLPCETTPATQPGTSGLPELPTTKYTYNTWDEPETVIETVGATTRTKTNTYDAAGRLKTAAISSTVGTALPTVTDEYNSTTGALEKQSTTTGGKTKTITDIANKLGQLESYTDAAETANKTKDEYDIDGRIKKVTGEKGTETYTYSTTTGLPTELVNEYGATKLKFTATYDAEGNMLTEGYPNGMTATYTYNQVDKPTSLVYKKTTNCTEEEKEKCKWFKDTIIPSIHGQWIEQTSSLSHQVYAYDNAGRLTEGQNTPAGKGCTVRLYAYDEDTNRTSLTTREPGTEGKCATEGGKPQEHTYDTADRLTDPGIAYDTFGDITTLPASDAEESAEHELTSTYYTDSQVASQKQNKQTIGYNLDPAGRTLETISTGEPHNFTILSHYTGPSNTPAWTINPVSNEWTRNITGINGSLVAIQNNGETPELQLTNLHGDIIAKAYLSETATELAAKADTSEFGVPTVTAPAKYSWLGASELPTELPSGVTTMGVRSYVPQIGRFLQPDPIPGGSANAYSYTFGDPVNSTDPTGAYTNEASAAVLAIMARQGEEIAARYRAEIREEETQAAERRGAELAARAAAEAAAAAAAAGPQYAEDEEWEEWWEEEGEYEYASYHPGSEEGHEAQVEPGLLLQPLSELTGETKAKTGAVVRVCRVASDGVRKEGPCARYASIFGSVGHWVSRHIIRPAEHVWKTTVSYIVRGATDAYRASGASFNTVRTGFEVGLREYMDDGGPPP